MKKWFVILLVVVAATDARAQQKLTLVDAISIALKNSYDVELVRNQLAISNINNKSFQSIKSFRTPIVTHNVTMWDLIFCK